MIPFPCKVFVCKVDTVIISKKINMCFNNAAELSSMARGQVTLGCL